MRILSLLPSATEIVYALGLEADLVGVTHECDWPPAARAKRSVSFSALPPAAEPAEVDRLVSASISGGEPIYRLDNEAVRELRPDLVLTQDLCAVCAVPSGHVNEALALLGCRAEVLSMDPSSLSEVLDLHPPRRHGDGDRCAGPDARRRPQVPARHGRRQRGRKREAAHLRPRVVRSALQRRPLGARDDRDGRGRAGPRQPGDAVGPGLLGTIVAASAQTVVFMPCGYDLGSGCGRGGAPARSGRVGGRRSLLRRRRQFVLLAAGARVSSTAWRSSPPLSIRRAFPRALREPCVAFATRRGGDDASRDALLRPFRPRGCGATPTRPTSACATKTRSTTWRSEGSGSCRDSPMSWRRPATPRPSRRPTGLPSKRTRSRNSGSCPPWS